MQKPVKSKPLYPELVRSLIDERLFSVAQVAAAHQANEIYVQRLLKQGRYNYWQQSSKPS